MNNKRKAAPDPVWAEKSKEGQSILCLDAMWVKKEGAMKSEFLAGMIPTLDEKTDVIRLPAAAMEQAQNIVPWITYCTRGDIVMLTEDYLQQLVMLMEYLNHDQADMYYRLAVQDLVNCHKHYLMTQGIADMISNLLDAEGKKSIDQEKFKVILSVSENHSDFNFHLATKIILKVDPFKKPEHLLAPYFPDEKSRLNAVEKYLQHMRIKQQALDWEVGDVGILYSSYGGDIKQAVLIDSIVSTRSDDVKISFFPLSSRDKLISAVFDPIHGDHDYNYLMISMNEARSNFVNCLAQPNTRLLKLCKLEGF